MDLIEIKGQITELMTKLDFPANAKDVLIDALEQVGKDKVLSELFDQWIEAYDQSEKMDYRQMITKIRERAVQIGLHTYTVSMLAFLCLGKRLKERYAERGYSEALYYDTVAVLRQQLDECWLMYGVVGSFVALWFVGFFDLTLFALGRLQFEIVKTEKDYTIGNRLLPAGSKAINMHIPQTGARLDHASVEDSYRRAAAWFADEFKDQPMVFTCLSWLLDPWNMTVLPENSNMAQFYRDFEIVEVEPNDSYYSLWPLFNCVYNGNPDDLPANTSLRRAYIERIRRGEVTGMGRGFFWWES